MNESSKVKNDNHGALARDGRRRIVVWLVGWLALLLIPCSLLVSSLVEIVRNEVVGAEYVCYMPDNYEKVEI